MRTNVEIEYCVPCGHLNRAMDTQRAILEKFGQDVEGVKLKTGHGGVFTIRVDGDDIYEKTQKFDITQVITDIEARI